MPQTFNNKNLLQNPYILQSIILILLAFRPFWMWAAVANPTVEHGRPANFVELSLVVLFAFYLFTRLGKNRREEEEKEPEVNLADNLLEKVPMERLNHFSEQGSTLLQRKKERGEVYLSLIKFDEKLYPKREKSFWQKVIHWVRKSNTHRKEV